MIRSFAKSRRVLAVGLILTAGLALFAVLRRAGSSVAFAAIAGILTLLLGLAFSFIVARTVAASEEQKVLALLHLELKPGAFVEAYAPVVRAMKPKSSSRVASAVNLADGYCASGEFSRALATLETPDENLPPAHRDALTALILRASCRYLLWSGDRSAAGAAVSRFEKFLTSLRATNPRLAEAMRSDAENYSLWLELLDGKTTDTAELERKMRATPTLLGKFDICRMICLAARNAGDAATSERIENLVAQEGGDLAFAHEIRARKKNSS